MENDFDYTLFEREWLLTNGLGGYALGFGNCINRRKYNGLLIASSPNQGRVHILSSVEEKLEYDHTVFYLDANHYADTIHPKGHLHLVRAWLRPFATFLYSSNPPHERYLVVKSIRMVPSENSTVIEYTNRGTASARLILQPKFTLRDHHDINAPGTWDRTSVEKSFETNHLSIHRPDNNYWGYLAIDRGTLIDSHVIYRSVFYPIEAMRGYFATEDLFSPVRIEAALLPGQSLNLVVSDRPIPSTGPVLKKIAAAYDHLPRPKTHPDHESFDEILALPKKTIEEFSLNDYPKILMEAASDFLVDNNDIIAGYPWFGCWGRDTLISMEMLHHFKNGSDRALQILNRYGSMIQNGRLPNTLGEGGEGGNLDTVDAPLWFVLRCCEFGRNSSQLFEYASKVVTNYIFNSDLPFFADSDGLVSIRPNLGALTWMDAKAGGDPVTPRSGKPVEINALWYNALRSIQEMAIAQKAQTITSSGYSLSLSDLKTLISRVAASFQTFVGDEYLADRIEEGSPLFEIRPNAVIAASLPFDCLDPSILRKVWQVARRDLLTPYGLRSLSPHDPAYKQKYIGNHRQRDIAYHQGTVWAFLLWPYVRLTFKVLDKSEARIEATNAVWTLRKEFLWGEIASVAEVYDAVDPYFPKGCPAQAWSVAALLNSEMLLKEGRVP